MLRTLRKAEYAELTILFFIQGGGDEHLVRAARLHPRRARDARHQAVRLRRDRAGGVRLAADVRRDGRPACGARARAALARVATAVMMALVSTAIKFGMPIAWLVLALIQIFDLVQRADVEHLLHASSLRGWRMPKGIRPDARHG